MRLYDAQFMKLLYPLLLVLCTVFCYGQKPKQKLKYRTIYLFKFDGRKVKQIDSADYMQVVSEPDSGSKLYNVKEYHKNGKVRFLGKSSTLYPITLQGQGLSYYTNGSKKLIAYYKDGYLTGAAYQFFPNGKPYLVKQYLTTIKKDTVKSTNHTTSFVKSYRDSLIISAFDTTGKALVEDGNGHFIQYDENFKTAVEDGFVKDSLLNGKLKGRDLDLNMIFEETYFKGKLVSGTSQDSAGVKFTYLQRFVSAKFPGGNEALNKYMQKKVRYPIWDNSWEVEGQVMLHFAVHRDGTIGKVEVFSSVEAGLDEESVRAFKLMPPWVPAKAYGKNALSDYDFPMSYNLIRY